MDHHLLRHDDLIEIFHVVRLDREVFVSGESPASEKGWHYGRSPAVEHTADRPKILMTGE